MLESLGRMVATNGRGWKRWQGSVLLLLLVASSGASCSFPDYAFSTSVVGNGGASAGALEAGAGSAGVGSFGGGAAGSASGAAGSASGAPGAPGTAGSAGNEEPSAAGAAGSDGGAENCAAEPPTAPAPGCANDTLDPDETDVDCGGSTCPRCIHEEACLTGSDCLSGECTNDKCVALVKLETQALLRTRDTSTIQFRFRLRTGAKLPLSSFSLRYYFARGASAEPLVPTSLQSVMDQTGTMADQTRWNIVRVSQAPADPTNPYPTDAYLEVTFTGGTIDAGHTLVLTQSIQAGSAPGKQFDQSSHYSFIDSDSYAFNEHAVVYWGNQLAWGTPPPYTQPQGCFYNAFNFAGPALTIGHHEFLAGDDPSVEFSGTTLNLTTTPIPPPEAYEQLLQTAIQLDMSAEATLHVPNGEYWVYPYAVSGGGMNLADLRVQGDPVVSFAAGVINNKPTWAKLGPYGATVSDGKLVFSSSDGALLRLAGVELFQKAN
ncbi:MAG: hypothetical protein ABW061_20130 [Polyangiaceae bacterium]